MFDLSTAYPSKPQSINPFKNSPLPQPISNNFCPFFKLYLSKRYFDNLLGYVVIGLSSRL